MKYTGRWCTYRGFCCKIIWKIEKLENLTSICVASDLKSTLFDCNRVRLYRSTILEQQFLHDWLYFTSKVLIVVRCIITTYSESTPRTIHFRGALYIYIFQYLIVNDKLASYCISTYELKVKVTHVANDDSYWLKSWVIDDDSVMVGHCSMERIPISNIY